MNTRFGISVTSFVIASEGRAIYIHRCGGNFVLEMYHREVISSYKCTNVSNFSFLGGSQKMSSIAKNLLHLLLDTIYIKGQNTISIPSSNMGYTVSMHLCLCCINELK